MKLPWAPGDLGRASIDAFITARGGTVEPTETVDVIPIRSADQLDACWVEGLKVLAPDDSVWRASTYCGGPGFWSSHKHGVWWPDLWKRYGNALRILGPSLRFNAGGVDQDL